MILLVALGLALSVWCSYVGISQDQAAASAIGGLGIVASIWLLVESRKGGGL